MHSWTLPDPLRGGLAAELLDQTISWLDEAVTAARSGQLDGRLFPLLFPAMFDDLFDELDHADTTRLALCDRHQATLAVARRALDGEPLDLDDLLGLASLASWVRRLARHLPELQGAGEVLTVVHLWAVEQASGALEVGGQDRFPNL